MSQTLKMLSVVFFVAAAFCLLLAVFLWFRFKIPSVIGDLSGRTAKKSIAKMRAENEKAGLKTGGRSNTKNDKTKSSAINSDNKKKNDKSIKIDSPETGLLAENMANNVGSEATGLLVDEEETAPLSNSSDKPKVKTAAIKLTLLEESIIVHTEETIEQ